MTMTKITLAVPPQFFDVLKDEVSRLEFEVDVSKLFMGKFVKLICMERGDEKWTVDKYVEEES